MNLQVEGFRSNCHDEEHVKLGITSRSTRKTVENAEIPMQYSLQSICYVWLGCFCVDL